MGSFCFVEEKNRQKIEKTNNVYYIHGSTNRVNQTKENAKIVKYGERKEHNIYKIAAIENSKE